MTRLLLRLPPEILLMIATSLPPRSQFALVLTSRKISCTVRHLLAKHEEGYLKYKTISTGIGNKAWDYLEDFGNDRYLAQYVETMDASKRMALYNPGHYRDVPGIQDYLEFPNRDRLQELVDMIDSCNHIQCLGTNKLEEPTAIESMDKGFIDNHKGCFDLFDEHIRLLDGHKEIFREIKRIFGPKDTESSEDRENADSSKWNPWDPPFGPISLDAIKWYSDIEYDRWFKNMRRPLLAYTCSQFNIAKIYKCYTLARLYGLPSNPLKDMVYSGFESPIIARLLTMASNLKTLNICLRFNDYCLLVVFTRILDAYRQSDNFTASFLPLCNLTRVSIVYGSPWCLEFLPLFLHLPSVEEIRFNSHGNYPSAMQRACFPLDTDTVNKKRSNVKTLIIELIHIGMDFIFQWFTFLLECNGLQSFYIEYSERKDPFPIFIIGLNLEHFATLKYLWFVVGEILWDPRDTIKRHRKLKICPERRNPFPVLHTLHAPWHSIVQAELFGYKLLGQSLRRLLLTGVPIEEQSNILLCVDAMLQLEEFGASTWICGLHPGDSEPHGKYAFPELRERIIRRGIKWLTFRDTCELENALTGR